MNLAKLSRTAALPLIAMTAMLTIAAIVNGQPLDPMTLTKYRDPLPAPAKITGSNLTIGMYEIQQYLHKDLEEASKPTRLWGYGTSQATATYPGPTIEALRGIPTRVNWFNALPMEHFLPVDETLHWANPPEWPGNGIPTVVHLHGGETEPESDGHPDAWFTQDFVHKGSGWKKSQYMYHNQQSATTLWYHDHALGITRLNVYAGLAAFYLLRDPAAESGLGLPSGDYEREIVIQDRMLNEDGSLLYEVEATNPLTHPAWGPEFFGDIIVVNGKIWPYLEVEPRKYRLRLLNGSNARVYDMKLDYPGLQFQQIGTDGGYLRAPVALDSLIMAPGERCDVIVDFSAVAPGTDFLLLNDANEPFPDGDPLDPQTTGQIMQFRVRGTAGSNPPIASTLNTIPVLSNPTVTRTLTLVEEMGPGGPLAMFLDGKKWNAAVSEIPTLGTTEMWEIVNLTVDTHPIHLHLVQFQLLNRQDFDATAYIAEYNALNTTIPAPSNTNPPLAPYLVGAPTGPDPNEDGWKDTVRMNPGQVSRIIVRFQPTHAPLASLQDFPFDATAEPGYVWHCHILEHEDNEMMRPYKLQRALPGMIAINDVKQSSTVDQLLRIPSVSDGAAALVGSVGDGYVRCEAIAVLHTAGLEGNGKTGAAAERIFVVANDYLVEIDPFSGLATEIGPVGYEGVSGLSFHPQSGKLYGVTYGTNLLLCIDINTGEGKIVTKKFVRGYKLNDMAFAPNGDLYVITDNSKPYLFLMDPAKNKKVQKWTLRGAKSLESLLWSLDGNTLYSAGDRKSYKDLCTIDLNTGQVSFVHPSEHSGFKDIEGLAWLHQGMDPASAGPAKVALAPGNGPEAEAALPMAREIVLEQNMPNPFNPTTRISFNLPRASEVQLTVYDVKGREIIRLVNDTMEAGRHTVEWTGRTSKGEHVASGLYFYKLQSGTVQQTRRMMILK